MLLSSFVVVARTHARTHAPSQDGDDCVSVAEFRTCFARLSLLYRSNHAEAADAEAQLIDQISPDVPAWMRRGAEEATKAVWGAFKVGEA